MNDDAIQQLYLDTQAVFDKSPIKKYAEDNNFIWNYSISATRLKDGANLIIGFNWGAESGKPYAAQTKVPMENFKDLYDNKWLGSMERIYQPLKQKFPNDDIDNAIQTNFCFFRSKIEEEISHEDLLFSTPLFLRLLDIIKPKRILGFSKKLQNYFRENNLYDQVASESIPSNQRTLHVAKGYLKDSQQKIPIYFLPHPNAKFTSVARKKAWDFCFG